MTGAGPTCFTNDCEPILGPTLAERAFDLSGGRSAVVASWPVVKRVAASDAEAVDLSAGQGSGSGVPEFPGGDGYRPDAFTWSEAMRVLVQQRPKFLWISLGDTDEWAHRMDYRHYVEALRAADEHLGELAAHLENLGAYGSGAAVFVTTDHGRDANFSSHGGKRSERVWMMSRGRGIAPRGVVHAERRRRLSDIAPTILSLLGANDHAECTSCGVVMDEILVPRTSEPQAPTPQVDSRSELAWLR